MKLNEDTVCNKALLKPWAFSGVRLLFLVSTSNIDVFFSFKEIHIHYSLWWGDGI